MLLLVFFSVETVAIPSTAIKVYAEENNEVIEEEIEETIFIKGQNASAMINANMKSSTARSLVAYWIRYVLEWVI